MSLYRLIKCLGNGSYGSVYLVKAYKNNKSYAMKRISTYNMREKDKRNLLNEIRILKHCECPYILKLIDVIANFTNIEIITDFARYGDFLYIIKRRKKIRFEEQLIWSYFIQVSLGLKYLHHNNIIHRDIKCANIFLNSGDSVVIGDLGSSKIIKQQTLNCTNNVGTPYYMCPQIMTNQEYSKDADIWGLGCFLFEIITFKPPFMANTYATLSRKIQNKQFSVNIEEYKLYYKIELIRLVGKILKKSHRLEIEDILKLPEVDEKKYLIPYTDVKDKNIIQFSEKFRDIVHYNWYEITKQMKSSNVKEKHNFRYKVRY